MSELSKYARDWLVNLRRESGGYPAEVLRHINAQAEEIEVLRLYGNKDCTAMADAELRRRRSVDQP